MDWQISKNIRILYLDISKALDKVSHDMPVNKMEKCGLYVSKRMLPDGKVSICRAVPVACHRVLTLILPYVPFL